MHCDNVLKQLQVFASGKLPTEVHQAVQAHLADCAACRAALGRVDSLAGILSAARTPPVPSGFTARVLATARQRQEAERIGAWSLLRWWRLTSAPMHAAAAAVLVMGLTVGLTMGWTTAPSAPRTSAAAGGDPLGTYRLDYLGDAPEESLAGTYLTLVSATNEGGY